MLKPILLLTLVILLSACSLQKPIIPTQQLTFEQEFELKIKNCNNLKTLQQIQDCKNNILLQQATSLDDITYCDYSSNTNSVNLCQSLFYLDKAEKNKNSAFCKLITNEPIKNICLNSVKD